MSVAPRFGPIVPDLAAHSTRGRPTYGDQSLEQGRRNQQLSHTFGGVLCDFSSLYGAVRPPRAPPPQPHGPSGCTRARCVGANTAHAPDVTPRSYRRRTLLKTGPQAGFAPSVRGVPEKELVLLNQAVSSGTQAPLRHRVFARSLIVLL